MKWIWMIGLCGAGAVWLQAASNDGGGALGGRNYIHVVNSLDTTLAFYRDVFGLEILGHRRARSKDTD